MTPDKVQHIVRNLEAAGAAFEDCQYKRCECGKPRDDCRLKYKIWRLALESAKKKVAEGLQERKVLNESGS